jgi:hypothetical protein
MKLFESKMEFEFKRKKNGRILVRAKAPGAMIYRTVRISVTSEEASDLVSELSIFVLDCFDDVKDGLGSESKRGWFCFGRLHLLQCKATVKELVEDSE